MYVGILEPQLYVYNVHIRMVASFKNRKNYRIIKCETDMTEIDYLFLLVSKGR